MDPAYARMNRELAPYQGFPHGEPRPVGDPGAGLFESHSPDAGGDREVLQARRQVGSPGTHALAEATPEAGGLLIPPVTR
jgi:hypothetical protein